MPHERRVFINLDSKQLFDISAKSDTASAETKNTIVSLNSEQSHHLSNVLRLKIGDGLTVIEQNSKIEFSAIIMSVSKSNNQVQIAITEQRTRDIPELSFVDTLIFSVCKGKTNDIICEKATELGISNIIFWQATRSIVQLEGKKDIEKKLERWRTIAESSAVQSSRVSIPKIEFFSDLSTLIFKVKTEKSASNSLLYCSLSEGAQAIHKYLPLTAPIKLIIGPEGDFTLDEEATLFDNGFKPLSLGSNRLRSETAAISAIAGINFILQK